MSKPDAAELDVKLEGILFRLFDRYPHPQELSKARTTKLVYLIDWEAAKRLGRQLTGITWRFNHYGPYVDEVVDMAKAHPLFEVVSTENMYGNPKELLRLATKDAQLEERLDDTERAIVDQVIAETSTLYWQPFIEKVYGTYPIATQPRYAELDLARLAKEDDSGTALLEVREAVAEDSGLKGLLMLTLTEAANNLTGQDLASFVDADLPSECTDAYFDVVEFDFPRPFTDIFVEAKRSPSTPLDITCSLRVPATGTVLAFMPRSEWGLRPAELDEQQGIEYSEEINKHTVEVSAQREFVFEYQVTYDGENVAFWDLVMVSGQAVPRE